MVVHFLDICEKETSSYSSKGWESALADMCDNVVEKELGRLSKTFCTPYNRDTNVLTNWVVYFLFKKLFYDCLCKVVRRRFGFA